MISNQTQLEASTDQILRLGGALRSVCQPDRMAENSKLSAVMAQGYLDQMQEILDEIDGFLDELKTEAFGMPEGGARSPAEAGCLAARSPDPPAEAGGKHGPA